MDGLTGISNYRRFDQFFNVEWKRAVRNASSISVILIDVDFFKLYNDTYGHQIGDDCLKKIAKKTDDTCNRPGDLVARYGGEEFAVIMANTPTQNALYYAERVRKAIEGMDFKKVCGASKLTISLGVATYPDAQISSADQLIDCSDKALYQAKENGRNQTCVYKVNTQ